MRAYAIIYIPVDFGSTLYLFQRHLCDPSPSWIWIALGLKLIVFT